MVEIRELVIQARLREDAELKSAAAKSSKKDDEEDGEEEDDLDSEPEWVRKIVERCLYEVQAWWREKNMR